MSGQLRGVVVRQLAMSLPFLYCGFLLMKKTSNTATAILLFTIAVFFLGPQLGSLDIDGDGVPDVPVMVMNGSSGPNVEAVGIEGQNAIEHKRVSIFSERTSNDSGLVERTNTADLRIPGLEPLTPLRC